MKRTLFIKFVRPACLAATSLFFAACGTVQPCVVNDPIGPLPSSFESATPHGTLIVYSDTQRPAIDPADYAPHSDYLLYSESGVRLRTVENRISAFGRGPAEVSLAVGKYRVLASAPRVGLVSLPVVIRDSQTTVVDLVNQVVPQSAADGNEWVRLPNGQIIGAKSQ